MESSPIVPRAKGGDRELPRLDVPEMRHRGEDLSIVQSVQQAVSPMPSSKQMGLTIRRVATRTTPLTTSRSILKRNQTHHMLQRRLRGMRTAGLVLGEGSVGKWRAVARETRVMLPGGERRERGHGWRSGSMGNGWRCFSACAPRRNTTWSCRSIPSMVRSAGFGV